MRKQGDERQPGGPVIFDRTLLRRRRERAASGVGAVDFLIREVAARLAERLADVRRRFPLALELGCHTGQLAAALGADAPIERLVQTDLALAMVARAPGLGLVADEELLPFGAERFDLVLSCLSLHWVNDLPGTLAQIGHALKPDGLLLAALPGGTTLPELREALLRAELELDGGASLRVSPFVDLRDAGALLQRAGFALPIVDLETIAVTYDHPAQADAGAASDGRGQCPRRPPAHADATGDAGEGLRDLSGAVRRPRGSGAGDLPDPDAVRLEAGSRSAPAAPARQRPGQPGEGPRSSARGPGGQGQAAARMTAAGCQRGTRPARTVPGHIAAA